jgi:hypothetical protein
MARKVDKLRPYRVDFFNIEEMNEDDQALVRSIVTRAVTAKQASDDISKDCKGAIIVVRARRFYGKIATSKKPVFKDLDSLFTAKKVDQVFKQIDTFHRTEIDAQFEGIEEFYKNLDPLEPWPSGSVKPFCPYGYSKTNPGTAHECAIHQLSDYPPTSTAPEHGDTIALAVAAPTQEPRQTLSGKLDPWLIGNMKSPSVSSMPLALKIAMFGGVIGLALIIISAILHSH